VGRFAFLKKKLNVNYYGIDEPEDLPEEIQKNKWVFT